MQETTNPQGQKLLVMKFGGTSIGTVDAMAQAVQIICNTHRDGQR